MARKRASFTRNLNAGSPISPRPISAWRSTLSGWQERYPLRYEQLEDGPLKPQYCIDSLRDNTPDDTIVAIITGNGGALWDSIKHLLLPAIALGFLLLVDIATFSRSAGVGLIAEVRAEDHIVREAHFRIGPLRKRHQARPRLRAGRPRHLRRRRAVGHDHRSRRRRRNR